MSSLGARLKAWLREKPTLGKQPLAPSGVRLEIYLYTNTGGMVTLTRVFANNHYGSYGSSKSEAQTTQAAILDWFMPSSGTRVPTFDLGTSVIRDDDLVALSTALIDTFGDKLV